VVNCGRNVDPEYRQIMEDRVYKSSGAEYKISIVVLGLDTCLRRYDKQQHM